MPKWKKWVKAGLGIGGAVVGSSIALSPTFRGIQQMAEGDPMGGANTVVFDITGMDPSSSNYNFKLDRIIGTGIVAAVGIGIMSLFRYVARRV